MHRLISACLFCSFVSGLMAADSPPLRAGIIGLDTSHVPAFTKLFNNAKPGDELASVKVVAGYPGGTQLPASRDRVARFTGMIRDMGVEIVATIPELLAKVDVVLLESVDGRIHLQEAIPVIRAKKPLFIDKPLAGSLADAIIISELARQHNVRWFSSSSSRLSPALQKLRESPEVGGIRGAATWGPCSYSEGTPDMFFYGIHGIEALFTLMGPGCETVARIQTPEADHVTGVWKDQRIGSYRGLRKNNQSSGAVAYGVKGIVPAEKGAGGSYEHLCRAIVRFFRSGEAPVSAEETLDLFAFMEAADESKRRQGAPVSVAEVRKKAEAEARARLAQLAAGGD